MACHSIAKLLGEELLKSSGDVMKSESFCGEGRVLGLYFSALWCPPCRNFTLQLETFYKKMKSGSRGNLFEVVFVSSDEDEKAFTEYFQDMPWLAVPFKEKDKKLKLSRRYRIQGIPALVLVNPNTCQPITCNGLDHLLDDPEGHKFPWYPRSLSDILSDGQLINSGGKHVDFSQVRDHYKGIYFSAHWCPPCKAFTPQLIHTYHKVKEYGHKFEIIFVSSDRSKESYDQYLYSMPWLAVPYQEEQRRKELTALFGVQGIPTLVIVDESNRIITYDGRGEMNQDADGVHFPWKPKLVNELTEKHAAVFNNKPCVILFVEGDPNELEFAETVLYPAAEEHRKNHSNTDDICLKFYIGGESEMCDSLREYVGLDDIVPLLTLLDIPSGKLYVLEDGVELTEESVKNFVSSYMEGSLTYTNIRR